MTYIFLDCDGTLTDLSGSLPVCSVEAVKLAKESGHKVFLCTGRSETEITDDLKKLNFDGYICSAGAAIVVDDELLIDKKIPKDKLIELIKVLDKYEIGYYLEGPSGAFVNDGYREIMEDFASKMPDTEELQYFLNILKPAEEADLSKICKLSYGKCRLSKEELINCVPEGFKVQEDSRTNNESMGEISQIGVDKASGIDDILNIFKDDEATVVAVGDGENDIDMLQRADIAIAIAHASDNLKGIADYITDEPENDGLLKAFKYYNLV